jgi:hypothetical protein
MELGSKRLNTQITKTQVLERFYCVADGDAHCQLAVVVRTLISAAVVTGPCK